MKNMMKFVAIVFGLAGVVACVDIILAEFFDKGTPPDISFMIVLLFWVVYPLHVFKEDLYNKLVRIPLVLSIILYTLSYFSVI
tara:strand:+ start:626 stop:874 length:249 start_codon:yes stop_codon:yes gene_type:complete